ncbi:hypothetical protein AB0301_02035 [Microbacterium profundi]|uniref:Uncharacterized protein n=1 Tax=Microbacterium profundi TaxID=450380 RepID=A0ABV3LD55_9MICO
MKKMLATVIEACLRRGKLNPDTVVETWMRLAQRADAAVPALG